MQLWEWDEEGEGGAGRTFRLRGETAERGHRRDRGSSHRTFEHHRGSPHQGRPPADQLRHRQRHRVLFNTNAERAPSQQFSGTAYRTPIDEKDAKSALWVFYFRLLHRNFHQFSLVGEQLHFRNNWLSLVGCGVTQTRADEARAVARTDRRETPGVRESLPERRDSAGLACPLTPALVRSRARIFLSRFRRG